MKKLTVRQAILNIYQEDNDIVNDRTKLLASVWRELGWNGFKSLEKNLIYLPSAETITREARSLISKGIIKLSPQEANRRFTAYEQKVAEYSNKVSKDVKTTR
jgi:hypothetical protein